MSQSGQDLQLLLDWSDREDRSRWREAGFLSVLAHVLVLAGLVLLPQPAARMPEPRAELCRVTPLIAPNELTQTAPNRGKISKEFNAESLAPRPRIQIPPSPPSTTRPAAPKPSLPTPKPSPPPSLPEPPKIEAANRGGADPQPPKLAETAQLAPPPQIQVPERPKLAFENPGAAPPPNPRGQALGKVAPPGSSVTEAVRSVARGGSSGGLVVGDVGSGIGGIGEGINLPPSPGRQGSNLELLSDPMGVDFRPYLVNILAQVRRNWFAVMPESAKLGRRGKVGIQFSISREGRVPKLVIVLPSGADALDRAAVAGVSASNPFPPLPSEFRGDQIRLQFTFVYNMPAN